MEDRSMITCYIVYTFWLGLTNSTRTTKFRSRWVFVNDMLGHSRSDDNGSG
ncbi:hypothetical protein HanRHA438_Chr01g0013361 [Helianthus annuus]|nr:hypothetical protein HanRHA438_Chr01g0013361 [Helianthus annuus]